MKVHLLGILGVGLLSQTLVSAQQVDLPPTEVQETAVIQNAEPVIRGNVVELQPVTVLSSPLSPLVSESTQSWSVLQGYGLDQVRGTTIGETLAWQPGVSQTFFGPNSSRPIIRGLEGNRVLVLQNGQDLFDVSAQSVDHAVAVDPLLIERVEILRGSSALLYGPNAVGGVVNVMDNTIPATRVDKLLSGKTRLSYNTVNNGWNAGTVAFTGDKNIAVQVHGIYRESSNYRIPSFYREEHHHDDHDHHGHDDHDHAHHDHAHEHEEPGRKVRHVSNSQSRTWQAGAGVSYLLENGYVGFGFSVMDSQYGIPTEERATIDLNRKRFEIRGGLRPDGTDWLTGINFGLVYGNYQHDEVESNGVVGTRFEREGVEARLEGVHEFEDLRGVMGLQMNVDETRLGGAHPLISGQETGRMIRKDDRFRLGVFLVEEYAINENLSWNGGVRGEYSSNKYRGNVSSKEDFTFSASTGLRYKLDKAWAISGNFTWSERPATTFERFADGVHHASESYEVGNPGLRNERSYGFEASLHRVEGPVTGRVTGYYTYYDDYIYLADTGRTVHVHHDHHGHDDHDDHEEHGHHEVHHSDFARREYRGVNAEFFGFEAELVWRAYEADKTFLDLKLFGDYVHARNLSDHSYLPRIAPWRIGAGAEIGYDAFRVGAQLIKAGKQTHTAPGEHSTEGYVLLNVFGSYTIETQAATLEWFARGNNLTNERAYQHTSYLKDSAPLAGIGFELGVTVSY